MLKRFIVAIRERWRFLLVSLLAFFVTLTLMGLWTSLRPPRITSDITPGDIGLRHEEATITTSDGLRLAGWWIPRQPASDDGETENPTIVLLHGYPADKGNILPPMRFLVEDANLLLFDFRYFGQSEGAYSTAGAKETEDLLAALRYLREERGVERAGVWGFSMGGAVALQAAAEDSTIAAVVSESSYASLPLIARELYRLPGLKTPLVWLTGAWAQLFTGTNIWAQSPEQAARELTIPVLLVHSRDDQVIPFAHAERLREAISDNPHAEFWFGEDLRHGELNTEYQQRIRAFFLEHLTTNPAD